MKILQALIQRASIRALDELQEDENYALCRKLPFFQELSDEALFILMKSLAERSYNEDEEVFREGNAGICMFIVKKGAVSIYSEKQSSETDDTFYVEVTEGGIFGEVSIVSMSYRTTSAKATQADTELLTLSAFDLQKLKASHPHDAFRLLRAITENIIGHLVDTDKKLRSLAEELKELKAEDDAE